MENRGDGNRMKDVLTIYVAKNGNDEWSGLLPEPNYSRTDGPFATVKRAQDEIRFMKKSQGLSKSVRVLIRDGTYFLKEPIVFTPDDSGTEDCKITYEAYPNERAIISGGLIVKRFDTKELDGLRVFVFELNELKDKNLTLRNLWVNGKRRYRSRLPKNGYFRVIIPETLKKAAWNEGQAEFYFHHGDLKSWKDLENAEIIVMNRWVESHLPIEKVDENNNLVTFKKKSVFQLDNDDPYYVENILEALSPGEFYFDKKSCMLYYAPTMDENSGNVNIIIPLLSQLVRFEGEPEKSNFVKYIEFKNLVFSHTEWQLPDDTSGYPQAAVDVAGAIYGNGIANCKFEECEFSHLGTYAIEFSRGCQNNIVTRCDFHDLGAGGIKIGEKIVRGNKEEQTYGNEISYCNIHNGGLIFHSAVAIWIGESYDNVVSHNEIYDFYYTGISVGWTWGYGNNIARRNIIEHNHIHNIGKLSDGNGPILSDMGGIYTLGIQPGTKIRFNLIHDISALKYGGWGIYLDEGSSFILVENNVVYRTTHGGFHQHYGKENVVRNNIFAFGKSTQIQRSRAEPHTSFIFEHNIVYYDEGVLLVGDSNNLNMFFDNNLYYNKDKGKLLFFNLTFKEWQSRGMDNNSLVADPLFISPENGDFRLKRGSPAIKIGFAPFELTYFRSDAHH